MIQLRGVSELIAALQAQQAAVAAATAAATREVAELVEQRAQRKLAEQSHPPRTPTPSMPGQPPATISGALSDSFHIEGPAVVGARVFARVGPTAVYSRIQELGGIGGWGATLPARPYLGPAVLESLSAIEAIYVRAWATALAGG